MVTSRTRIPEELRLTYDDLIRLFGKPSRDGKRYELFDGVLAVTPSPVVNHQRVIRRLMRVLDISVEEHELGEVFLSPIDVILANDRMLIPDLCFVSSARSHIVSERGIEDGPDLVIEVLSPCTEARDRGIKRELNAEHGVRECWLVDPVATSVERYTASESELVLTQSAAGEATLTSMILPGLELEVARLFRD